MKSEKELKRQRLKLRRSRFKALIKQAKLLIQDINQRDLNELLIDNNEVV